MSGQMTNTTPPIILRARWNQRAAVVTGGIGLACVVVALLLPHRWALVAWVWVALLALLALFGLWCWRYPRVELTDDDLVCHWVSKGRRVPVDQIERVDLTRAGWFTVLSLVIDGEPSLLGPGSTRKDMEENLAVVRQWWRERGGERVAATRPPRGPVADRVLREGTLMRRPWLWVLVPLLLTVAMAVEGPWRHVPPLAWVVCAVALVLGAGAWNVTRKRVGVRLEGDRLLLTGARTRSVAAGDVARVLTFQGSSIAVQLVDGHHVGIPVAARLSDGGPTGGLLQDWAQQHGGGGGTDAELPARPHRTWWRVALFVLAPVAIAAQVVVAARPEDPEKFLMLPMMIFGSAIGSIIAPDPVVIDWSKR